jgi:CRP-like cAMP-binding protein
MDAVNSHASPVFAGFNDRERLTILSASRPQTLKAREVLAREGDPAGVFYVVQMGHLKLARLSADGSEVVMRFVGPGGPFGGVVGAGGTHYPLTATAAEPTRVLGWPRAILEELMLGYPRLRTNIIVQISNHLSDALTRVQEVTSDRVEQRVARALIRLVAHGGTPTPTGVDIAHPLTRHELAGLVGTTQFTVSRLLARWEADGLIASKRRRITVLAPDRLAALAEPPATR